MPKKSFIIEKRRVSAAGLNLSEKLIAVRRVAKTVTGGRRFRFTALVAVGDGQGHVGLGYGKGREIPEAMQKAISQARRNLIRVPIVRDTIPHEIMVKYGASRVFLKPAPPGTGVIAGRTVRAIVEAAGIKDILTKSLGSRNPLNLAKATIYALCQLKDPAEEEKKRGKKLKLYLPGGMPK